jgi:hypothetical protein
MPCMRFLDQNLSSKRHFHVEMMVSGSFLEKHIELEKIESKRSVPNHCTLSVERRERVELKR